jgi:hypothetical protein
MGSERTWKSCAWAEGVAMAERRGLCGRLEGNGIRQRVTRAGQPDGGRSEGTWSPTRASRRASRRETQTFGSS